MLLRQIVFESRCKGDLFVVGADIDIAPRSNLTSFLMQVQDAFGNSLGALQLPKLVGLDQNVELREVEAAFLLQEWVDLAVIDNLELF